MKEERKQTLLMMFPKLPEQWEAEMRMNKRKAENFCVFIAQGSILYVRCYHKYTSNELLEVQRFVFAEDGCVRYGWNYQKCRWSVRRDFTEPKFYRSFYGYCDNSYRVLGMSEYRKTYLKYSEAEKYRGVFLMLYFRFYTKHRNAEFLMKQGYASLVTDMVDSNSAPPVNWKSNNLLKMLDLNRTEFKVLKGSENDYERYIHWREEFPKLKPHQLLALAQTFGSDVGTMHEICVRTGANPVRLGDYFASQKIRMRDYQDYLDQCRNLSYSMRDTAVCFPRDFAAMHTRLTGIVKYRHSMEVRAEFERNFEGRTALEFAFGKLFIRQPKSIDEITDEGKALCHCVGGYAERHAKGRLNIMFIRQADSPDVPFYTVEVSANGEVIQVRGLRNCKPTPEVADFMEHYRKYLEKIYAKKERKSA